MITMKAFNQEKLLPALISHKKDDPPKILYPEFTGAINVNPLRTKPKNPLDLKLKEFEEPKNEKNRKIFNNYKQEQHYRLNRENKLKVNEEITNYLKNSKYQPDSVYKKFHIRNEKDQIKDAAKQYEEINYILEHNKKYPTKKSSQLRKNFDGLSFLDDKLNRNRLPSQSNLKHMCTKGLRNKMTHYNVTNSDKKFHSSEKHNENKKGCFSSSDVLIASDLLNKITNQRNKKTIKNAIGNLNVRLAYSKEKVMQDYETSLKRSREKSLEMEYYKTKRAPKYKSVKDVKLDVDKIKEFDDEIKAKAKLAEDPKEMKLLYKNDIFQIKDDRSENQFDRNDFPEKYKKFLKANEELNDLKIRPELEGDNTKNITMYPMKSPKKETLEIIPEKVEMAKQLEKIGKKDEGLNTFFTEPEKNNSPRNRKNATRSPKSNETNSKSVGNEPELNNLEKSILNSNYLSKEFHLDIGNYDNNTGDNIVNWADKFKITQPKKWSKDLEYFLT